VDDHQQAHVVRINQDGTVQHVCTEALRSARGCTDSIDEAVPFTVPNEQIAS
jgi:hypothetical protein